jgi:hypothetical protein
MGLKENLAYLETANLQAILTALQANSSVAAFNPDTAPASPGAFDDEFADGSTSGWTEFDPGSVVVISEGAYGFKVVNTSAALKWGGGFKAIPAGDFTLVTRMHLGSINSSQTWGGICLTEDISGGSATADLLSFGLVSAANNSCKLNVSTWSGYDTFSSDLLAVADLLYKQKVYLRVRRVSTTYSFDYSFDGIAWTQHYSNTISITPTHVLLGLATSQSNSVAYFRFIRQMASQALDTPLLGR